MTTDDQPDKAYRNAKHPLTRIPVGATWEAKTDTGKIGRIWLEQRTEYLEMWRWCTFWSDGDVNKQDWNPTYKLCREEIPLWNKGNKKLRFRRVK